LVKALDLRDDAEKTRGKAEVRIARVYDGPDESVGARLLVDRVWPRGIRKEALCHDDWIRNVAPSDTLRKWVGHDRKKWEEFRRRYHDELNDNPDAVNRCLAWCRKGQITLLHSARDRVHNQALVLRDYLRKRLDRDDGA
jgi:uncharacterized protein YeaO (DUF488 family)